MNCFRFETFAYSGAFRYTAQDLAFSIQAMYSIRGRIPAQSPVLQNTP